MPLILKDSTDQSVTDDPCAYIVLSGKCCIARIYRADPCGSVPRWQWRMCKTFECPESEGLAVSLEGALETLTRNWRKTVSQMALREIE